MSRWEERVESSDAIAALGALEEELSQIVKDVPKEQAAELARLRKVIAAARSRLESDAALTTPEMLSRFHEYVTPVRTAVQAQVSRPDPDTPPDLTAANNAADDLIDILAEWMPPTRREKNREVERLITSLRNDSDVALAGLRSEVELLVEQVEQAKVSFSDTSARLEELGSAIDDQKTRLEMVHQEQATRFDNAQETYRQQVNAQMEEQREEQQQQLAQNATAAEAVIEEIGARRDEAVKIVGVIANTGMAGGYQEYAKEEFETANRYRLYTLLAGLAAIGVLLWAVVVGTFDEVDPGRLALKVALSVAIGGLAGYTARQSAQHREVARRARNIQLALASIRPYLAELDVAKRDKVIEAFSFLFFAPPPGGDANKESGPGNFDTFFKAINEP